jgi:hypothetical protein
MGGIVDVVYVNTVTLYVGCERMGELAKGWGSCVSIPGTRVDGYSHHEQKKLVLQVSNKGEGREGRGRGKRGRKGRIRGVTA